MQNEINKNRLNQMQSLIEQGMTGSDICRELGIKPIQAKLLHYELLTSQRVNLDFKLGFEEGRFLVVSKKGDIPALTRSRLTSIGAAEFFPVGTKIRTKKVDGGVLITPIEIKEASSESENSIGSDSLTSDSANPISGGDK